MSNWNEDRKATLRTMWLEGATSTEIARTLGGVTRNAVMGKVHRMGLMGSPTHSQMSTAKRSGCCAAGWSRVVGESPSDQAQPDETTGASVVEVEQVDAAQVDAAQVASAEPQMAAEATDTSPLVPETAVEAETVSTELSPSWLEDGDQPEVQADGESDIAAAPANDPVPAAATISDPAERRLAIASFARKARAAVPARSSSRTAPRAAVPSSRAYRPSDDVSRMPPRGRDLPPPSEIAFSGGVMSSLGAMHPGTAEWRDVFKVLKDLTGVPYDERVPGHGAALVAIATVVARGDPRSVLLPALPEPSILRIMRRFAEKGVVVAGKPPARWTEDVDDRAFYEEMVHLAAA